MAIAAVPSGPHLELPLKTSPKPKETETTGEVAGKVALQEVEAKIFEEIKELGKLSSLVSMLNACLIPKIIKKRKEIQECIDTKLKNCT